MPIRLTGMDAAFLYLETPTSHMHVGGVLVVDPSTAPGGRLTREDMIEFIDRRLHLAAPFRRRLAWVPMNLDHPWWIEDPDFDLRFHVRRAALPAPGGIRELAEFAGDVMSRPIDRGRPLWEMWVVEGLSDGRAALVIKTHHAAIDGVSGAELTAALCQLTPDQEAPAPERPWVPESPPADLRLLATAGLRLASTPLSLLRTGRRLVESAIGVVNVNRTFGEAPPPVPFQAPMSPLNGAISPHRLVSFSEISLAAVKHVKDALGGTVNDVVLATVAGALRTFLLGRGADVSQPLVAMVPISVRGNEEHDLGNQVSAMFVELPTDDPDPESRLASITTGTCQAKHQHGALGATTIRQVAELAPGAVSSMAARLYSRMQGADHHRPIWNVVVSNVPGPRFPLYTAGARLEAFYPLGPVHEMVGLNVTLFSYEDTIFVGLNADRDLVPDVDMIGAEMRQAVDELAKAATQRSAR